MQLGTGRADQPAHIMAGDEARRAQLSGGRQQIAKLDGLVARNAWNRRLAAEIGIGKWLDNRLAELRFIVEHVVRNTQRIGDPAGIVDVLSRAAGA